MRMRWLSLTLWVGFLGLSHLVQGQSDVAVPSVPDTSDAAVYRSFFQQTAGQRDTATAVLLNGQPSPLIQPSLQEALGIAPQEAQKLQSVAVACNQKLVPFEQAIRSLVWEARLQALQSGAVSSDLRQRLTALEGERNRLTRIYRQQVKDELGSSAFQAIDGYIRLKKSAGQFFPPVPSSN